MSKINIFYVRTSKDSIPGSLRDAINQANLLTFSKIIIKSSVGNYIKLKNGELNISSNIKLINQTGNDLTICSKCNQRIFHISSSSQLFKISSSDNKKTILSNGKSDTNGGAIYVEPSTHQLILKNVVIINNTVVLYGGGIYSNGYITLISSCVESNQAGSQGGGIWSGKEIILQHSTVSKNKILIPNENSGGGGIYVDNGNCVLNASSVVNNKVAYDTNIGGGSGGGIIVMVGSIYVQNNSHVDNNSAFNSGGIQEGQGDVYVINESSVNQNQSFNQVQGAAGGGGITMIFGNVYISNSQVCDNKTKGMYSGGIVTIIGDVNVIEHSKIMRNSNNGPGGGIAVNLGTVTINNSYVSNNTGASLGGGIVNFTPSPGFISISGNSEVSNNYLTNAETIAQTIEIFLEVITNNLSSIGKQSSQNGSSGAIILQLIPDIIQQLLPISDALKAIITNKIGIGNLIGGGGIACLLSTNIKIDNSCIMNNYAGKNVSSDNFPFSSYGGGILAFESQIILLNTEISNNTTLSSGGGIWSNNSINANNSNIIKNNIKHDGQGGGIYINSDGVTTLINTNINYNFSKNNGGGIYNNGKLSLILSEIKKNKAKVTGGGIYSNKSLINIDTKIIENYPNNIIIF